MAYTFLGCTCDYCGAFISADEKYEVWGKTVVCEWCQSNIENDAMYTEQFIEDEE